VHTSCFGHLFDSTHPEVMRLGKRDIKCSARRGSYEGRDQLNRYLHHHLNGAVAIQTKPSLTSNHASAVSKAGIK
jgi:hypothetical protein